MYGTTSCAITMLKFSSNVNYMLLFFSFCVLQDVPLKNNNIQGFQVPQYVVFLNSRCLLSRGVFNVPG